MDPKEAFKIDGESISVSCANGRTFSGRVYEVEAFDEDEPDSLSIETASMDYIQIPLSHIVSYKMIR